MKKVYCIKCPYRRFWRSTRNIFTWLCFEYFSRPRLMFYQNFGITWTLIPSEDITTLQKFLQSHTLKNEQQKITVMFWQALPLNNADNFFNARQCLEFIFHDLGCWFLYNNIYTKLKTNVKKHTTVPRRQYTVCLVEKLKCKKP